MSKFSVVLTSVDNEVTPANSSHSTAPGQMAASLVEMLNGIPTRSQQDDDQLELALEKIAYDRIKPLL